MAGKSPVSNTATDLVKTLGNPPSIAYTEILEREFNMKIEKELEEVFHMVTMLDLLEAKTKLEKAGKMTAGLAACFRHALEMLRKDKDVFYDSRLLMQADGNFLTFHRQTYYKTYVLWYDQYLGTVQEEHLKDD